MRKLFRSLFFLVVVVYFSTAMAVISQIWVPPGWMGSIGVGFPNIAREGNLGERIEDGKEGGGAGIAEKIEVWTEVMEEKTRESMQVFLHPLKNIRAVLGCGNLLFRAGMVFLFLFLVRL